MAYLILSIFGTLVILSYLEPYLGKYKRAIYLGTCTIMVFMAGLREVGFDPDSETYEYYYHNFYSTDLELTVDYSFLWLSEFFNHFTDDVHALFLLYAALALSIKFYTFRHFSESFFLPLLVYAGFYYELHDMTQIRTGLLSAFFLLSLIPLSEGKKGQAASLIAFGSLFHLSGLALIPAGYVIYNMGVFIFMQLDIPYIGEKLMGYQADDEKGIGVVNVNVFNIRHLFSIFIFYFLLFFQDTICSFNKYYPIMMKLMAIGLFFYTGFAFIPVVADRIGLQYQIVSVFLFSNIYYTIKPRWASTSLVVLIAFFFLNYTMPYLFKFRILYGNV